MDVKVDISMFTTSDDGLELDSVFEQPILGVTMNEFTEMLTEFVNGRLGSGDHSSLVHNLIKFADSDKDSRVPA